MGKRGGGFPGGGGGMNMNNLMKQAQKMQRQMEESQAEFETKEFEATAGGSALKGEDGLSCAKRELLEETGISDGRLTALGRTLSKETIYCVFLCLTDCNKGAITLQEGETVSYKWLSEKDFVSFVKSKEMIPQQRERFRSYFEKMGYLD